MPFCLPKQYLEKVKQAIKDGKFDIEKFNTDSETRRNMLESIVGKESAEQVNTIYEKKLLLKNQEKAMYDFVKEITGLSAEAKEKTAAKIKQTYADKNRRLYDPKENESFLNEITSDLYSKKYKTEVSLEEAQTITELSADVKHAKEKMNSDFTWKSEEDGIDFGAKKVASDNYIGSLKVEARQPERTLINPLREKGIKGKVGAIIDNAKIAVNFIAENSRAMVASMDNSLWFRQGIKALKDPRYTKIWSEDFAKSWVDIYKTVRGQIGSEPIGKNIFFGKDAIKAGDAVIDAVKAEAYSRQNYLNGRYEAKTGDGPAGTKLDIGTGEEAYPTSTPSRIPIIGRFFKGSEVAYEGGAMRLRMDIADQVYSWAEKTGVDMTDNQQVGGLNETVNQITGRATFGKRAGSIEKAANTAFFSIKFFKSNLDYLTSPLRYLLDVDSAGKKLAATNLLYTAAVTGLILQLAKTLNPNDNKDIFNSTSSNFGKIRNGNMTIDTTGGAGGIMVMMSKILTQKSTSSTTGITTQLGQGYGSQTGMDVLWSFTENKFSPLFQVIKDLIKQQTFSGKKPTIQSEVGGILAPISLQNISQFKTEPVAMQIIGLIADGVGLNTNVYAPSTDWGASTGKELQQFKQEVGD